MASAKEMGCTIKLLCIAQRTSDPTGGSAVSVRVHPAMIPLTHPLASVGDAFNAVFVEAEAAGPLMFYGRGAGGRPTASAVLGDIVAAARNKLTGTRAPSESNYAQLPVRPIGESLTRYHISLDVAEKPGVLATVAGVFAHHEVSIATVRQSGREDDAKLVIVTHSAPDAALAATVEALSRLDIVRSIASVLRVEGGAG
jgi:homoserine dehydrogenase